MHATTMGRKTGFDALDVSLDWIGALRGVIEQIRKHDADLARQLRKAAASVPLNLSEGRQRRGKERRYRWGVAAGSAAEAKSCLLVAESWGYVEADELAKAIDLLDRILAMLWRLTH